MPHSHSLTALTSAFLLLYSMSWNISISPSRETSATLSAVTLFHRLSRVLPSRMNLVPRRCRRCDRRMRPSSRSRGTPSALLSPSKERTGKPLWWQLRRTSMTLPTLSMVRRHLTGFAMMSETVQRLISQSGWCGRNRSERWRSEMSKTPSLVKVCATRLATITVVTMGSRKWTLDVHSTMMKTREMEVRWTPPSMAAAPASA
mmetsp:Transcript_29147/g.66066  ORF Transcript_29147/g.66066 Transcript_29147/m.66066 type:complete len:203 (-) Transcript_29147:380-988(-)